MSRKKEKASAVVVSLFLLQVTAERLGLVDRAAAAAVAAAAAAAAIGGRQVFGGLFLSHRLLSFSCQIDSR